MWTLVLVVTATAVIIAVSSNNRRLIMATNKEQLAEFNTRLGAVSETLGRGFDEVVGRIRQLEANSDLDFGPLNESVSRLEAGVRALDGIVPDAAPADETDEADEPAVEPAEPAEPADDEDTAGTPAEPETPGPEAPVAPAPVDEVPATDVEPETEDSVESEPNTPA